MTSLEHLIQGASIPELKEVLRLFQARCPQSNDLAQLLTGTLDFEEKASKEGLRKVVEGVCVSFTECHAVVDELLNIDEDEFPRRSCILDRSPEGGSDSGTELPRKKRRKRKRGGDLLSSPPKPVKQKKRKEVQCGNALLPETVPSWWPGMSAVESKSKASSSILAPPKKKRTIAEIFEADRQRRELEARQEAERRRHEIEIQANCARCKSFFLADNNRRNSRVFHSGTLRRKHWTDNGENDKYVCCGRDWRDRGCRQWKHIDDRVPGAIERVKALQGSAWKEARTVVYRSCEECETDVEVEYESEDEDEDEDEEHDSSDDEDDSMGPNDKHGSRSEESLVPCNGMLVNYEETRLLDKNFIAPDEKGDSESVVETSGTVRRKAISINADLDGSFRPLTKESDVEDDDSSELSDIEFPGLQALLSDPDRFLCHSCQEKAAAKRLQCTVCGDNFKALPSWDAYTAENPICGRCEWANRWRDDYCLECEGLFEPPMRPHWYDSEGDCYEDGLCPACKRKMEDEEEVERERGS